jgi:hypothetical protein
MKWKAIYIITEGEGDARILEAALGALTQGSQVPVHFRSSYGFNSAVTTAGTLRHFPDVLTLLVLDSDTLDERRRQEREEFARHFLGEDNEHFRLVMMTPEIESLFFTDKTSLESALNMSISEDAWRFGQFAPSQALMALSNQPKADCINQLLSHTHLRKSLGDHPEIQKLRQFAQSA